MFHGAELGHSLGTGRGGDNLDATGTIHQNVLQITVARQNILEVAIGSDAQQDVDIGEPQIGVEQHHSPAFLRQGDSEVHRHVTLADTTLSAGNCNHLYRMCSAHTVFGLSPRFAGFVSDACCQSVRSQACSFRPSATACCCWSVFSRSTANRTSGTASAWCRSSGIFWPSV